MQHQDSKMANAGIAVAQCARRRNNRRHVARQNIYAPDRSEAERRKRTLWRHAGTAIKLGTGQRARWSRPISAITSVGVSPEESGGADQPMMELSSGEAHDPARRSPPTWLHPQLGHSARPGRRWDRLTSARGTSSRSTIGRIRRRALKGRARTRCCISKHHCAGR